MEEINQEVLEISNAMNVIDQISFQTNILSLNAAVEAGKEGNLGVAGDGGTIPVHDGDGD